jgi:hypothetical protein
MTVADRNPAPARMVEQVRHRRAPRLWVGAIDRVDLALAIAAGSILIGAGLTRGPVGGLLGFGVALGLVAGLWNRTLIGYGAILLVPITSGFARGLPIPSLRLSEAAVVGAALIVLGRTAGRRDYRWQVLDWAAFAYVGFHALLGLFGAVVNSRLTVSGAQVLVGPVQFFLLYRVVRATIVTPAQRRLAIRIVVLASVPVSLVAIAQYVGVPGVQAAVQTITRSDVFDLWGYSNQNRATGPFDSWHPLAGYLFLPIALCVAQLGASDRSALPRWLTTTSMCAAALALVVSQTLNVLAGIVIVAVVITIVTGRVRQILLPMLAVGAVAAVAFGPVVLARLDDQAVTSSSSDGFEAPQTISYRIEVWTDQYLPALDHYWLIGYGPDLPDGIEWRSTESLYFTLLIRGGLVLSGAFVLLNVLVVRAAWRSRRDDDPALRLVALALIGAVVALVPMHAVFPYFTASGLPQVFWILVALLAGPSSAAARALNQRTTASVGSSADLPSPRRYAVERV